MRAHTKAGGDWLELLLLFVNAVTGAPPPSLVHKRSMCRIHQPDNAMVDGAGKVDAQIGGVELFAEPGDPRDFVGRFFPTGEACTRGTGVRHENPDEAGAFRAGVAAGVDASD